MPFYAGRLGSISVGGAAQKLTDWSLDYKCDPIETTNFEDEGYASHVYGIRSADISASGPYGGAAGGQPGTGDSVTFLLETGGPSFSIDAVLTSVKIDQSIKDVAKISYTATSTGEFTITV
ncbi:hypothetical protein UFOVP822_52 [uncultured Caudovirales phage]|uniref:Uncharacterized protein n=1 Tax=uncultured Caudovirales phage TaxID=2100421 RepID=A0A6J5P7P6_9CAUD|nr:hypothetical protein UFOVP822_52 [uncultured Caudovirales phage]